MQAVRGVFPGAGRRAVKALGPGLGLLVRLVDEKGQ